LTALHYGILAVAAIPFIYYVLAMWSTVRFFREARKENKPNGDFTPPILRKLREFLPAGLSGIRNCFLRRL
jgi:hypothetical protein